MAEYRLTPAAERDLEGIWVYTVQQWDVAQANRYILDGRFRGVGATAQNNIGL